MNDQRPLRQEDYLALAEELRLYKEENRRLMDMSHERACQEKEDRHSTPCKTTLRVVVGIALFQVWLALLWFLFS